MRVKGPLGPPGAGAGATGCLTGLTGVSGVSGALATGVPYRSFRLLVIRAMVGVALLIVFVAVTLNAKRTLRSRSVKTISVLVVGYARRWASSTTIYWLVDNPRLTSRTTEATVTLALNALVPSAALLRAARAARSDGTSASILVTCRA